MTLVRAFGRFWWDFLVGDDWKVAAAALSVLALGAILVAGEIGVGGRLLAPLLAVGIAAAFTAGLLIDVRLRRRPG